MAEVTLGGKRRELKFNFKSMLALEKHFQKPINQIFENEMQSQSLGTMIVVFWSFLINDDKKITPNKVEDLISDSIDNGEITMEELGSKISETMDESLITQSSGSDAGVETGEGESETDSKN